MSLSGGSHYMGVGPTLNDLIGIRQRLNGSDRRLLIGCIVMLSLKIEYTTIFELYVLFPLHGVFDFMLHIAQ